MGPIIQAFLSFSHFSIFVECLCVPLSVLKRKNPVGNPILSPHGWWRWRWRVLPAAISVSLKLCSFYIMSVEISTVKVLVVIGQDEDSLSLLQSSHQQVEGKGAKVWGGVTRLAGGRCGGWWRWMMSWWLIVRCSFILVEICFILGCGGDKSNNTQPSADRLAWSVLGIDQFLFIVHWGSWDSVYPFLCHQVVGDLFVLPSS